MTGEHFVQTEPLIVFVLFIRNERTRFNSVTLVENSYITMTETRFYEPARLSTPAKFLFSLKPLDANLVELVEVIVI